MAFLASELLPNVSVKSIFVDGPHTLENGTLLSKPLIPQLPGSVWRVGVAPFEKMNPDCITKPKLCKKGQAGLDLELLSLVATMLNASLTFVTESEAGCGYQDRNTRNWTGLMRRLQNNEIDIIGNLCTANQYRTNVGFANYSFPVLRYRQSYLIKLPEPVFQFYVWGPFQQEIWFVLLLSIVTYPILNSILLKMFLKVKFKSSIANSFVETLQGIAGMNTAVWDPYLSFVWMSYITFFTVAYATYVKGAIITPITVERPMKHYLELIESLKNEKFKFVDYHEKNKLAYPRTNNYTTDKIMMSTIEEVGYHYSNSHENQAGTNKMLQEILDNENLVLVKGRFWIDTYLDSFANRTDLWVMDDDFAADEVSAYFYRTDFVSKQYFNLALMAVSNFQVNFNNLYRGLAKMTHDKNFVKGEIPDKTVVDMKSMIGPISCYFIGIAISLLGFGVELFRSGKFKFKRAAKYSIMVPSK